MGNNILVIGAGITGIEASILLANAGKHVYLVEKSPIIGGNIIKFEHVFPNLECATCLVSPRQQEVLQNSNIELLLLSEVKKVTGKPGAFSVKIKKQARYVDMENCIGCGACYDVCPVKIPNEYEENLMQRFAIYVPYSGSLPNVPAIDTENCIRFAGEECNACQESCMFEAINYDEKDEELDLKVDAIIVSTGFQQHKPVAKYGWGTIDDVYNAFEFERIFASNGPTTGEIKKKDGSEPKSIAIIHCVGRDENKYCSAVCCINSLKFIHYLKEKIEDIKITNFYRDLCLPGKKYDKFAGDMKSLGTDFIRSDDIEISSGDKSILVNYMNGDAKKQLPADMVILSSSIEPQKDNNDLAKVLGIELDSFGFFQESDPDFGTETSTRDGIYIAGCAQAPKDIQNCVTQAQSAVEKALFQFNLK